MGEFRGQMSRSSQYMEWVESKIMQRRADMRLNRDAGIKGLTNRRGMAEKSSDQE
jgi:hypothetical protein